MTDFLVRVFIKDRDNVSDMKVRENTAFSAAAWALPATFCFSGSST